MCPCALSRILSCIAVITLQSGLINCEKLCFFCGTHCLIVLYCYQLNKMSSWISKRLSRELDQVECSDLSLVLMKGRPVVGPSPPIVCLASKIFSCCSMLCSAIISDEKISVHAHRGYAVPTLEAVFYLLLSVRGTKCTPAFVFRFQHSVGKSLFISQCMIRSLSY